MSDKPKHKTEIYEDKTFFGDYLESTSEKDFFAQAFVSRVAGVPVRDLLDLGCFDGSLTKKIVRGLLSAGHAVQLVTAVEPAAGPLREFADSVEQSDLSQVGIQWNFVNQGMEEFLSRPIELVDWVIASHSLYWMGSGRSVIEKILKVGRRGVLVIRDPGLLHQVEVKYRPMMTPKPKFFVSSDEVCAALSACSTNYEIQKFTASMRVPDVGTLAFKQLAGFLLDLTLEELDEKLLPQLYQDLKVENGRSTYGIDIIWFN